MSIINVYNCSCCDRIYRMQEKSEYITHLKFHAKERMFERKQNKVVEKVKDFFGDDQLNISKLFSDIKIFYLYFEYCTLRLASDVSDINDRYEAAIPKYDEVTGMYVVQGEEHSLYFCKNGLSIPSKFNADNKRKLHTRYMPGLPNGGELYMTFGKESNVPIAIRFSNPPPKIIATLKMYG